MSEMERLEARFKVMQRDGLLDFQFTLDPREPRPTVEQLAADLNECLDAIDRGEYEDLTPLGDSKHPLPDSSLGSQLCEIDDVPSLGHVVAKHFRHESK